MGSNADSKGGDSLVNLTRTALAALAGAALAAGGSTTVFVTSAGNSHGVEQRSDRAAEAQTAAAARSGAAQEAAEVDLPPCPADVKNHGAYVSSVAKSGKAERAAARAARKAAAKASGKPDAKPEKPAKDEGEQGAHGALVSAAAQSDCGKPEGAGDDDAAESTTEGSKADKESKAEKDAAKAAAKAEREAAREAGAAARASATPGPADSTP